MDDPIGNENKYDRDTKTNDIDFLARADVLLAVLFAL